MLHQFEGHIKVGGPPDNWFRYKVKLNGVEQKDVLAASTTEGWVLKYLTNADGFYIIEPTGGVAVQEVKGYVEVEYEDDE